ncbi:MAG: rod shape-determining protein [Eubacteriales bacterium]|nr:rod shape-determining protein [Eubacteriales bacterium]
MQWDIGLEIGQTGVRLCTRERGETLVSPAWGASRKGETIALGDEALSMRGRTLKGVSVGRPVENGSVADPRLLGGWIARILGPLLSASRLSKPSVALVDSGFFRRSELDLMRAAVTELGASRCGFIQADLLAAIGSGVDVADPKGTLVVRVGAGTMSAFIVSYGRIVRCVRRTQGAEEIDRGIVRLLREECGLGVGLEQAEALKKALSARLTDRGETACVAGLDLTSGFPVRREVSAGLIKRAVDPISDAAVRMTLEVLGQAPDELCADLLDSGIVLTGGGARIGGLDALLHEQCALRCRVADAPEEASYHAMARVLRDEQLSELIEA